MPVVPGSDLTRELLGGGIKSALIAVVGGDAALHGALAARYPQFTFVCHAPPMGVLGDPAARLRIAEFIEAAAADIVFLALGAGAFALFGWYAALLRKV